MFASDSQGFLVQSIQNNLLDSLELSDMQSDTNQICADESTNAEALLRLGVLYWRRGNFDRSEQLLTKAREISAGHQDNRFLSHCFIALALVKTSLEKDDDAIIAYKQAIKLSPDNFHLWNNLASLYLKKGQFEKALLAYENTLKINPGDVVAWNGVASIYYRNENVEEAINIYKRLIDLLPEVNIENPKFHHRNPEVNKLFVLPWLRLAELYAKNCQYLKAVETYKKALKFDDKNAEIWNEIGTLFVKINAVEESLHAFSKAIELNPEYGDAYLNLGCAYVKLEKPQDSIPMFSKSIAFLSNKQDRELASSLMDKAMRDFNRENNFRSGSSNENVTWIYNGYDEEFTSSNFTRPVYEQERTADNSPDNHPKKIASDPVATMDAQQAKKGDFTMLGQLTPSTQNDTHPNTGFRPGHTRNTADEISDPVAWNEIGNSHFYGQNYREAIISYYNAIKIEPTYGQPYHNLALIHFIQGNYDDSILLYLKSIRLLITDHDKAIAWNGLGDVYRCKKDYEHARLAYQRATEIEKKIGSFIEKSIVFEIGEEQRTANFWNDLGKLLFKSGNYSKAASAFQKAIQLEPSSGPAYGDLARALTAQGQYKEAIPLYRNSIELTPNKREKAKAWNRLGDVHRKLNDYDSALKAYQNATKLTNEKFSLLNRARMSLLSNCTAK